MCGIFAYSWNKNATTILIKWLQNLEYRWYDSAGMFCQNEEWENKLFKSVWKVSNLNNELNKFRSNKDTKNIKFTNWIAHTRWATHGKVTLENTHPHYSQNKRFFIVHNWIIENYIDLRKELEKKYTFYSETDTEIIAKLIENLFDWNLQSTLEKVTHKIVWAYAIVVIDKNNPNEIIGIKHWSPMIVWVNSEEIFLSSDINALSNVADDFISLENNETIVIKWNTYSIYSLWKKVNKELTWLDSNSETASKWTFDTFTEKEISEIPDAFENAFKWRINFETLEINNDTLDELNEYDFERVEIIASWSSYFAWLVWANWFKEIAWIECETRISPEFLYSRFIPNKKTLYIFISQSGETADVLQSLKMVKAKLCFTFWIVNVVASTIANMSDLWLYSKAWIEVSVASTKNIIWQLSVLILMALSMWLKRDLQLKDAKQIISKLKDLPNKFREQLNSDNLDKIKDISKAYSKYSSLFFLGRNVVYWTAQECALKFKETTWIHAECYATWELKHGPLALINKDMPCIVINPKWILREKTMSNIQEIKSRHWRVLWIITKWDSNSWEYDETIEIPTTHPLLTPFLPLIPIWTMSVETTKLLWRNVDKPANLAKSVTVE